MTSLHDPRPLQEHEQGDKCLSNRVCRVLEQEDGTVCTIVASSGPSSGCCGMVSRKSQRRFRRSDNICVSARTRFTKINGCLSYIKKCLWRKVQECRLSTEYCESEETRVQITMCADLGILKLEYL